jgi:hypothetical protein
MFSSAALAPCSTVLLSLLVYFTQPITAQTNTTSNLTNEQANTAVDGLCKQMLYMPGCSVKSMCASNSDVQSKPFCHPVSYYADICTLDMPRMSDCKSYTDICFVQPSTVNGQIQFFPNSSSICEEHLPIANIPTTEQTNNLIKSICGGMDMEGCSSCKINSAVSSKYLDCDQLKVYSDLCIAMPEMNECATWKSMCASSDSALPYCKADISSPTFAPTMKMFFHTGFSEYVLFKEWVPKNQIQYSVACLGLFILSIFYEGLVAFHSICEAKWTKSSRDAACFPAKLPNGIPDDSTLIAFTSPHWKKGLGIAFGRAGFKFVNATLGYALMLVTMTFNVGLYFSVVSGLAAGTLFFGGFVRRAQLSGKLEESSTTGCC